MSESADSSKAFNKMGWVGLGLT
ncbi:uncharacterized protein G2W53_034161 [Senna tora]|uniref:Uncharacterized protein n=1 Tax=Senna tora TaxID=362788 RepID=A0A834W7J0_9FABA|nr:uncharacterized protein G2W53_034161 [Senna tora]